VAGETPPPEDQQGADERTDAADTPTEPVQEAGETPGAPEAASGDESAPDEQPAGEQTDAAGPTGPDAPQAADADAAPAAEAEAPQAADAEAEAPQAANAEADAGEDDGEGEAPRAKPAIPGADLEVDIVVDGEDPLALEGEGEDGDSSDDDELVEQPIAAAAIDLAAGARYSATGKRKSAIARVVLRPGSGAYTINGKPLDDYFPRATLQRNIRQPLEAVGYEERMDVVARMNGGGVSAQAGALRHGISRALLEADPNLRGELKRRGFLTRDARAKERKKAGLKKARKRPQFSKR
jgi:small subunit ribosomal protein S9